MKKIIYQLLLRSYGQRQWKANGTLEENGCGKFNDITDDVLRRLKDDLHIDAIWYTGVLSHTTCTHFDGIVDDNPAIVKGMAGSPYAVKNAFDVDPALAVNVADRMSEFEALVSRTHEVGIKVVIDFIPNHMSRHYQKPFEQDNFFVLNGMELKLPVSGNYAESPALATGNDCFCATPCITDWYDTVKLNYENRYTWQKMLDVLLFWCSKGVDGFRCDMVEMVTDDFFRWAFAKVREIYPDVIFIAEAYNKDNYWRYRNAGFDLLYDKSGFYDSLRSISSGMRPAYWLTDEWQFLGDLQPHMLNFLENHDEQRVASDFFLGDPRKAYAPMAVSLLFNRAWFMLYAGQERGERGMAQEGFSGCDGRSSIFDYCALTWHEGDKHLSDSVYAAYCELFALAAEDLFSKGDTYDLMYVNMNGGLDPCRQFAFMRGYEGRTALVVANFADCDVEVQVNIPDDAWAFFGSAPCKIFTQPVKISANGYTVVRS